MSVDLEEAVRIVHTILVENFGEGLRTDDGDTVVLLAEKATDYGEAWLIPFNSKRYLDSGDPLYIFLPGAILVPKDRQHRAHVPPSAFDIPRYLDLLRSGEISWPE